MRIFIAFLLVFLLVGCTSNTIYKKPDDLIPKDTMSMVIEDLFISTSSKNIKNKFMQRRIDYHPLIVQKYGIDSVRFSKSSIYYMSRVDDYQKILEQSVKSLKEKRDKVQEEIKFNDSIKRATVKKVNDSLTLKIKEKLKE